MTDIKKKLSPAAASWAKGILRRASVRWWAKHAAYKEAFIRKEGRLHLHECFMCKGEFKKNDTNADHIDPVVPVDKSLKELTMDEFCANLLVDTSGYQILCKPCHNIKTETENSQRKPKEKNVKAKKKTKRKSKKKSTKASKKSRLGRSG